MALSPPFVLNCIVKKVEINKNKQMFRKDQLQQCLHSQKKKCSSNYVSFFCIWKRIAVLVLQ